MAMRRTNGGSGGAAPETDFDDLFRSVWPRAVVAARRIVGPGGDPEGIAAEALTRAFDRWPSVRRHPAPEAWVLRVTINLSLDRVRHQTRVGVTVQLSAHDQVPGDVVEGFDESTVVRLALCAALRELPEKQRNAVALRYLGGCVEEDIAAAMMISPGTVRTHLKRGLEKLRAREGNDPEASLALAP